MTAERAKTLGERGPATANGRSVRLTWTDPVTRDRIAVDLSGPDGFVRGLLELGFELAQDSCGEAPESRAAGAGVSARARSTRSRPEGRAGDAA